jgi:hypothetical protein
MAKSVGIIVLVALVLFRAPIIRALDRTKKFKIPGFEADAEELPSTQEQ